MRCKVFIIFLLLLPFSAVLAQTVQPVPVDISTELVKIQGKVFYVHRVLKGQTLYSISRTYGVTQDEINQYNPQLAGTGLQEGMFLQILQKTGQPLPAAAANTFTAPAPAPATVTPVAVADDNTVDIITEVNPDLLSEKLSEKEESTLPVSCRYEEKLPDINQCESYIYNPEKSAQVALLLPFSAEQLVRQFSIDSVSTNARTRNSSDNFIEFYGGALIALQDIKEKGFAVEVSVFDVAGSYALKSMINSERLKNMDLIIGPVYASSLAELLPYADQQNIPVVSPLDTHSETLLPEYPNLFQVSPPLACQHQKLLSGISPKENNVILVYDKESEEQTLLNIYKTILSGYPSFSLLPYKVSKGVAVRDSIRKRLLFNKENCIVVASNNEALVTDLVSNLSSLQSKNKYSITLYGQARWRNFENVDISFLHAMNLHLVIPFFADYKDSDVKNFVTRYRQDFHAEPSRYAFQGYDVMKFFLTALYRYGPHFGDCISLLQVKLLQGSYQFRRQTPQSGFINTGSSLIHYTPEFDITRE